VIGLATIVAGYIFNHWPTDPNAGANIGAGFVIALGCAIAVAGAAWAAIKLVLRWVGKGNRRGG
jgi:hypothetical protein